jgi:hypothetical protein
MVWDSICGGRGFGIAALVLVMAGGAGALLHAPTPNDDGGSDYSKNRNAL